MERKHMSICDERFEVLYFKLISARLNTRSRILRISSMLGLSPITFLLTSKGLEDLESTFSE